MSCNLPIKSHYLACCFAVSYSNQICVQKYTLHYVFSILQNFAFHNNKKVWLTTACVTQNMKNHNFLIRIFIHQGRASCIGVWMRYDICAWTKYERMWRDNTAFLGQRVFSKQIWWGETDPLWLLVFPHISRKLCIICSRWLREIMNQG